MENNTSPNSSEVPSNVEMVDQSMSIKEQIIGLLSAGYKRKELIGRMGYSARTVDQAIKTFKDRQGKHVPPSRIRYDTQHPTVAFRVSKDEYTEFQAIAKKRGVTISQLISDTITGVNELSAIKQSTPAASTTDMTSISVQDIADALLKRASNAIDRDTLLTGQIVELEKNLHREEEENRRLRSENGRILKLHNEFIEGKRREEGLVKELGSVQSLMSKAKMRPEDLVDKNTTVDRRIADKSLTATKTQRSANSDVKLGQT